MNKNQKTFLWIGIAIIVLAGAFPPWIYKIVNYVGTNQRNAGYSFIFKPPTAIPYLWYVCVDTSRLYIQWVVTAVITSGFIMTFKDNKED